MLNNVSLTPSQVAALIASMQVTEKNAGTTPGTRLHGPGGMLGNYGLNPQTINAMVMPTGLAGKLKAIASTNTNEIIPILTGLTASTGSQNTTACADGKTVGSLKVCHQTYPFGRLSLESQVLQVDRVGETINRGEFTDNVLFGAPQVENNISPAINWTSALRSEVDKKLTELFAGYAREYAPLIYSGNFINTAGNTGYQEYYGLDTIINTGKRDALNNGVLCPAADSTVVDFAGLNVSTNGSTAYAYIAAVVNKLRRLAKQTGLEEVEWVFTGTFGLFYELTAIWPCVYATARCNPDTIVRSASLEEQTAMRDEMRNGEYLLVEGKPIPFIIDDSITETIPGAVGTYQSDLYLVPLRAKGKEITYLQYFSMLPEAIAAANAMAPAGSFVPYNGGRFLLHRKPPSNECVQVRVTERPRLIMDAPFLAARFTDLRYTITANQHQRDPFPGSPYFVNGGSTQAQLPYFYPPL